MRNIIKTLIEDKQRDIKIPTGVRILVRRACNATIAFNKLTENCEVNVSFVSNSEIQQLNKQYRGIDAETDVLSFSTSEDGKWDVNPETGRKILGDIIISAEMADKQANDFGHSFQREVCYLATHGLLHLLGYDHVDGGLPAMRMREAEEAVMTQLGLTRELV